VAETARHRKGGQIKGGLFGGPRAKSVKRMSVKLSPAGKTRINMVVRNRREDQDEEKRIVWESQNAWTGCAKQKFLSKLGTLGKGTFTKACRKQPQVEERGELRTVTEKNAVSGGDKSISQDLKIESRKKKRRDVLGLGGGGLISQ